MTNAMKTSRTADPNLALLIDAEIVREIECRQINGDTFWVVHFEHGRPRYFSRGSRMQRWAARLVRELDAA